MHIRYTNPPLLWRFIFVTLFIPTRVRELQRIIVAVGIAIIPHGGRRITDEGIGTEELAEDGVVNTAVHIDVIKLVHMLMHGEAAGGD
jgi:hypothetical protein